VLLDEIGRGTSTYDGVAIAWAVTEHLHNVVGCKTIFATHYHELTQLTEELAHARNFNVAVREAGAEIVFLHRLEPGGADRSYGFHGGQLNGLPAPVVARAWPVLALLAAGHDVADLAPAGRAAAARLGLFDQKVEGDVILRLFVDSAGRLVPESSRVAESSNYPALDSAALAGARKLRFAPARRHGLSIATAFLQPVECRHPQASGAVSKGEPDTTRPRP